MDFDDEDKPKEVAKTRRFAPGRAGMSKPKPKPTAEKPSQAEHEVDAKPKVEPEVNTGAVKMEIDSKLDKEPETSEEKQDEDGEEEEDVVVREIDVFFNPSIDANTQLYVLQYPLRPSWRPYEMDERCEEVRVNPSTSQVEIDLSMDVHSNNYNSEFNTEFGKINMTKQTLTTTWKPPRTSDYAIGVLSGDKLHLNPVHAVAQLRPSMEYFPSINKENQAESTVESAGTSKKQVVRKGVQASKDQNPVDEENWVALKYHGLQSEFCSRYLSRMMANGNSSIDFNMSPDVYINSLCRGGRNSVSKDSLKRALTSLPLEERLQKLLCEGPPLLRYNVLKHYAPDVSDEEFLKVLQQFAVLVQGLWTPKTKLLKLEGPVEASRDYILSLFSKDTTIKYSIVEATGRLREKMKTVLNVFAKERPLLCDWKFKEPTDVSFIKSYPRIAQEHNIVWNAMEEKLKTKINIGVRGRGDNGRNVASKNPSNTVKPEAPTTLSDKAGSSRNTIPRVVGQKMPEETRRALAKALKKVLQTHKVCSFETICQGLRDLAVSKSNQPKADSSMAQLVASAVDAHPEELQQVISEVAVNIHGSFVSMSMSSTDQPSEYDPLRGVVIDLLRGSPPGTKLMKADVFEAGRTQLSREITSNEYTKVMRELCATNSSGWVLMKAR